MKTTRPRLAICCLSVASALVACSTPEASKSPQDVSAQTRPYGEEPYYAATTPSNTGKSTASTSSASGAARGAPVPADVQRALQEGYAAGKAAKGGKNADYIPALAKVDPNLFGITIVTADGGMTELGDATHAFSIQSVSKPFTLARVIEDVGPDVVEKKIGVNATGQAFNSIVAIEATRAGEEKPPPASNPLVNAGAITSVSMVPAATPEERWTRIMGTMNAFAGRHLTVNQEVYESEAKTNTRNRSIAWLLDAYEGLGSEPMQALDLYTRQCSISVNAHDLAMMGATLANGGVNPVTKQRVVSADNAAKVLAVMMTAGLYETSGDWAYRVGVPAKSGVGGGIVAVVPGRFAVATFAPPLDPAGNSVRGQKAIEKVVEVLGGDVFSAKKTE